MESYRLKRDKEENEKIKALVKKKDKELNDALEKQAIQAEKDFLKCIDNLRAQMRII